jgi:hypothetical protein
MSDLHGLAAEDVVAIQAVIMKYGFVIDDRTYDRVGEVFTADATVDYRDHRYDPPAPPTMGPFVGIAAIRKMLDDLDDMHPIQHMMVSHLIDSADGDEVVVRTKALLPMRAGGVADIAYRDVLVRTPAGWRIKEKTTYSYRPMVQPG